MSNQQNTGALFFLHHHIREAFVDPSAESISLVLRSFQHFSHKKVDTRVKELVTYALQPDLADEQAHQVVMELHELCMQLQKLTPQNTPSN